MKGKKKKYREIKPEEEVFSICGEPLIKAKDKKLMLAYPCIGKNCFREGGKSCLTLSPESEVAVIGRIIVVNKKNQQQKVA